MKNVNRTFSLTTVKSYNSIVKEHTVLSHLILKEIPWFLETRILLPKDFTDHTRADMPEVPIMPHTSPGSGLMYYSWGPGPDALYGGWCEDVGTVLQYHTYTHSQKEANGMLNETGSWIIEPFGPCWLTPLACVPSGPNLCSHRNGFHGSLVPAQHSGAISAGPPFI